MKIRETHEPQSPQALQHFIGSVVPLKAPPIAEPWLTKAQLADRLQVSTRWIDYRRSEGMPCEKWAGIVRFRLSEIEAWLEEQ